MIRKFAYASSVASVLVGSYALAKDVIVDAALFTVKISSAVEYPFGQDFKGTSRGAGFLVDRERGWILTNAHVASSSFI